MTDVACVVLMRMVASDHRLTAFEPLMICLPGGRSGDRADPADDGGSDTVHVGRHLDAGTAGDVDDRDLNDFL